MGVEVTQRYEEVQVIEDGDISDSELIFHVRHALLATKEGDVESYHQLVGVMHHSRRLGPDELALLVTSLKALSGAVCYIDIAYHESLLNSIFGMCIWNYGPDVMDALIELITSLAASNGKYIDSCLDMLVSNFVPPFYLLDVIKEPRGQAKKEQVLSRVHKALEDIVSLVPMAGLRLSSVVVHRMPMTFRDTGNGHMKHRTEMFVENMLKLENGALRKFVGSRMLMAVMDMLIELDVAIGWNNILLDDSCRGIFAIEMEDEDESLDDEDYDVNELPRTLSHKYLGKNVIADLLDSLMVRTFEHLECCTNNHRLNEVFETLLSSFMLTVLNTYKSKFAQFVIFYACALDPEKSGVKFANSLLDKFICGENPLARISAVAYLASYLSRAKFLSARFVSSILERLVDWCLEYCNTCSGVMNPQTHRVFYAGCQAVMYVLCFRMTSILDIPGCRSRLLLHMQPILKNKLEPFKVCLPSIVQEFLKQAKAANIFMPSNELIFSDSLESDLSLEFGGMERLDTFFPFDPCLLSKSDRGYIRPNYVYWNCVRTTYDAINEDSSDEEFELATGESLMLEDIEQNNEEHDLNLEEFDYAMNQMSLTPGNSSVQRFGGDQLQMPSRIRPSTSPQFL